MGYLDWELESYQYYQDTTCGVCGECTDPDYYDCRCEEEEDEHLGIQWWFARLVWLRRSVVDLLFFYPYFYRQGFLIV